MINVINTHTRRSLQHFCGIEVILQDVTNAAGCGDYDVVTATFEFA